MTVSEVRVARLEAEVRILGDEFEQLRVQVQELRDREPSPAVGKAVTTEPSPAKPAQPARPSPARVAPAPTELWAEGRELELRSLRLEKSKAPPAPVAPAAPPTAGPPPTPAPRPVPAEGPRVARRPAPPPPPRRTLGDLARDWDLMGARGLALAGGAVMALGIGFFFVLAANRGWIDAQARVAMGAAASALVFGAGLVLRSRYGQYWSALAAVAAGTAGAYATLAAAAARYDLVPDALALPLAAAIAAVATTVGLRWKSEAIAAIGLLGAALAPALQSLDTAMTWESAAFAVIVLVAVGAVSVPRDWIPLLLTGAVLVGLQAEWLVYDALDPPGRGTVAVAAAFCLVLLGTAVGWRVRRRAGDLDALALGYATVSFGAALLLTLQLFSDPTDRGWVFVAAGVVWALVFAGLQLTGLADLGLVVATSALALLAIGTVDLLAGSTLTVVWAAESIALTAIAWRLGDARLRLAGIVYAALAAGQALVTDASPRLLFDELESQRGAVLPLAAVAVAAATSGTLVPREYAKRTEAGLLAFMRAVRRTFERSRIGIVEALDLAAAAFATLAAAYALVAASFDWGHVAASALAAAVGATALAIAARRRRFGLALASYIWLGVVLVEAAGFDADTFYDDVAEVSVGGWSIAAAAAGLLGGAYGHRVLHPARKYADQLLGVMSAAAALSALAAVALVSETARELGVGYLVVTLAYGGLAAGIFRRAGYRDSATVLWSIGLVFLVLAEAALVTDATWRAVAIALTGLVVGLLGPWLDEMRLWLAGGALVVATTAAATIVYVQPWLEEGEMTRRHAFVTVACALASFGLAGRVWLQVRWRNLVTVLWVVGVAAVLATERVLIDDLRRTAFAYALTAAVLALVARPLREVRLWYGAAILLGVTTTASFVLLTPLSHLFTASESPAAGVWVLAGCIAAIGVVSWTAPEVEARLVTAVIAGSLALYGVSLAILEVAVRVSGGTVETGFERGHTAVSAVWALVGLALLVVGLLRGSAPIRYGGLALFGLSLAKIFVYDLAELSSVARAFSFILVGALLLAGGFFLQRLSDRIGPPRPPATPTTT